MASSDSGAPNASDKTATEGDAEAEAQRAADGLKDQIAALRARVRSAQNHLRGGRRGKEPRSFGK
jgi:hypothetical protein